jgi:hypothetical protein
MAALKDYIQGGQNNFPTLKVPRQWPLVLLVEVPLRGKVKL